MPVSKERQREIQRLYRQRKKGIVLTSPDNTSPDNTSPPITQEMWDNLQSQIATHGRRLDRQRDYIKRLQQQIDELRLQNNLLIRSQKAGGTSSSPDFDPTAW